MIIPKPIMDLLESTDVDQHWRGRVLLRRYVIATWQDNQPAS